MDIPLKEALNLENTFIKLTDSQRCCSTYNRESCQNRATSCVSNQCNARRLERNCPFAKIRLRSYDFQFFSRKSLILHCRDRLSPGSVTRIDELHRSLFRTEAVAADSKALDNCLWEDPSHDSHRLPRSVSLGRGVCYNFIIDVFLDHSDFSGIIS